MVSEKLIEIWKRKGRADKLREEGIVDEPTETKQQEQPKQKKLSKKERRKLREEGQATLISARIYPENYKQIENYPNKNKRLNDIISEYVRLNKKEYEREEARDRKFLEDERT